MLRAEGAAVASELEKALPAYALNLSKTGQEVTVEGLLMAARQGESFPKQHSSVEKSEDPLAAYERIVKGFSSCMEKTPEEQLIISAWQGDIEKIKSLIENGVDVTARNNLVIIRAVANGHNDTVWTLLEHDADVTALKNLAIILAAENGHSNTVRLLIKNGANVSSLNNLAITRAARNGHNDTVQLLIDHGADVTAEDNYAITRAAANGHNDTVRLLIKHGADVTAEDNYAIRWAARNGHVDTTRLLIAQGADITAQENYAIRWAAVKGRNDTVRLLIAQGADVTAQENYAIRWAAANGHSDTVQLLIENGADQSVLFVEHKKTLQAHEEGASLWQRTVRMKPPFGLYTENPAFFKKACFETVVEMLAKEDYQVEEANTMAFHTAGLFQSEQRVLQYLEQWGVAGKQPLHDLVQMIRLPRAGEPNMKDWGDAVLKCGPSMAKLVKFGDRIPSPLKSADGKTWSMVNTRAECAKHSFKKAAEHPELAALCFEHDVDEGDFNKALKLIQEIEPEKKTIPDLLIDGDRFGAEGARFYRLAADDMRGLFLGEMTGCCQSIGGVGSACAEHGYTSRDSGFYVVENAKGRIVAQTWAWRGEKGEMCFDSLETLGGNVTADQWKEILKEAAKELTARKDHDITALHVGTGGNTPDSALREAFKKSATAKPKDYSGYRDSKGPQLVVWKR